MNETINNDIFCIVSLFKATACLLALRVFDRDLRYLWPLCVRHKPIDLAVANTIYYYEFIIEAAAKNYILCNYLVTQETRRTATTAASRFRHVWLSAPQICYECRIACNADNRFRNCLPPCRRKRKTNKNKVRKSRVTLQRIRVISRRISNKKRNRGKLTVCPMMMLNFSLSTKVINF